jgi:hypothetical protein
MIKTYPISWKTAALAAGMAAAVSSSANAVTYTYAGLTGGGVNVGLQIGAESASGEIGEFKMTTADPGFASPLLTYCVDVGEFLAPAANYTVTPLTTPSTGVPLRIAGGIQNAATLWINDKAGATTATQTAGLQLAIWELLYNTPLPSYTIANFQSPANSGFFVTTTDAGTLAALNAAVADLNAFGSLTPEVGQVAWLSPNNADGRPTGFQGLFIDIPGVPETASTLGMLGLSVIALCVANRKLSAAKV